MHATSLHPHDDRTLERALFLLISVICLHSGWLIHSADPFEFLRHGGDQLGYYQWLPAVFVDHDVDHMYWTYHMEDGRSLSLFSIGVALLQLPFFLLGHLWAAAFDYPMNGFSSPYGVAQLLGIAAYAGAGCVLAFRLARRFSTSAAALLATLSLFAATNLFYYSVYEPTMSHLYSFLLIGLFAHCSFRLFDGPENGARARYATLFLIAGSWLVLVRQLNIILFVLPLSLAIGSPGGLAGFVRSLLPVRTSTITGWTLALLPWILQFWYWQHVLGEFLVFTYGKKGETFHFGKMVPGMVMVSVRNGWFVYSPLMIGACAALLAGAWRGRRPARTIVLILSLSWLLYSAWWAWWLGTSYGYRGFVDLYALLCIPLAWLFNAILDRPWHWRMVTAVLMVALIKLNFGLMDRFRWEWSWEGWNWRKFFEQVSAVITG